ncbi:MAG: response regulator [Verrucomicrobiota bacterium]|jgi:DNA-binding response OmpR family regulator
MKDKTFTNGGEPDSARLQREPNAPQRILVVDDDSLIRHLNTTVLIHSGYEVDTAEDGAAAWEALQVKDFNLLITDHSMPRMTGVELVKKLRSARMSLPVILATGTLPLEELDRNPELQLAAMLPKPFTVKELLKTVRVVLRATDSASGQCEPLPDWRSQRPVSSLRL